MIKRINKTPELSDAKTKEMEDFFSKMKRANKGLDLMEKSCVEGGIVDKYALNYDWRNALGDKGTEKNTDFLGNVHDDTFILKGVIYRTGKTIKAITHYAPAYMTEGVMALNKAMTDDEILDAVVKRKKDKSGKANGKEADDYDMLFDTADKILEDTMPDYLIAAPIYNCIREIIVSCRIYNIVGRITEDGKVLSEDEYNLDDYCPMTDPLSFMSWNRRLFKREWYKNSNPLKRMVICSAYYHICYRINRLAKLKEMGAPQIILQNEYRMACEIAYGMFAEYVGVTRDFPEIYECDFTGNKFIVFNAERMDEGFYDDYDIKNTRVPGDLPRYTKDEDGNDIGIDYVYDVTDDTWKALNSDYVDTLIERFKEVA